MACRANTHTHSHSCLLLDDSNPRGLTHLLPTRHLFASNERAKVSIIIFIAHSLVFFPDVYLQLLLPSLRTFYANPRR